MRHINTALALLLVLLVAVIAFGSCKNNSPAYYESFRVYGDETPGIGGDENKPDIAEVYVDQKNQEYAMHYPKNVYTQNTNLNMPYIKVIEWPGNFKEIMEQTGEINSPMKFRVTGDTLHIEFTRD